MKPGWPDSRTFLGRMVRLASCPQCDYDSHVPGSCHWPPPPLQPDTSLGPPCPRCACFSCRPDLRPRLRSQWEGREEEKYTRESGELHNIPGIKDNSFARDYICSRSDKYHPDNAELLVGCQVNVARDILYLVTALLVLMEFGFDFRVCELGKSGQKQ